MARVRRGEISRPEAPAGGINTHVHTAKSFSYFGSPSDAVWAAFFARLSVFGINDHYTIAGHPEFREACRVAGIRPMFSMEAVAMWGDAERAGATVNDPNNPGRTYLTAKGVTRRFAPGCSGERDLAGMNAALLARNREITNRLAAVVKKRLDRGSSISFEDVLALTPHDQPTERHVVLALAKFLEREFPSVDDRASAIGGLVGGGDRP